MYISQNTAERIKILAKKKNIVIKDMLTDCGLNKNVLSTMLSRGSWLQANNLAKIADYLDCSVDYLLGRTDVPEVNYGQPEESRYRIAAWGAKQTKSDDQPPVDETKLK